MTKKIIAGLIVGAGVISAPIITAISIKQEVKTEYLDKVIIKEKEVIKETQISAKPPLNETTIEFLNRHATKAKAQAKELGTLKYLKNLRYDLTTLANILAASNGDIPAFLLAVEAHTYTYNSKSYKSFDKYEVANIKKWIESKI